MIYIDINKNGRKVIQRSYRIVYRMKTYLYFDFIL